MRYILSSAVPIFCYLWKHSKLFYLINMTFKLPFSSKTRHLSISIPNEINIRSSPGIMKKLAHVRNLSALHPVPERSIFIYSLSRRSICSLSFSTSTSRPLSPFPLQPLALFLLAFLFPSRSRPCPAPSRFYFLVSSRLSVLRSVCGLRLSRFRPPCIPRLVSSRQGVSQRSCGQRGGRFEFNYPILNCP